MDGEAVIKSQDRRLEERDRRTVKGRKSRGCVWGSHIRNVKCKVERNERRIIGEEE